MRRKALGSLLLLTLLGVLIYWGYLAQVGRQAGPGLADGRVPVPTNRGPEVMDGFSGALHPHLRRHAKLEVTACWQCEHDEHVLVSVPHEVRQLFQNLSVAIPTKSYTARDFSALLPPAKLTTVGQPWALDPNKVAVFLKQFHPAPSMRTASAGKRPGPDGAFAVLRAVSPSHLDIVFRIHAQFDLLPKPSTLPVLEASYTPACFLGRLVLNRSAGTVEYFQLGVPTDSSFNVHITVSDYDHDFIHVDRMELAGGNLHGIDGVRWEDQIDTLQTHDQLAKVFYKFKEINWVPFQRTQETARAQKKPIFAVVLWGALDDQSC